MYSYSKESHPDKNSQKEVNKQWEQRQYGKSGCEGEGGGRRSSQGIHQDGKNALSEVRLAGLNLNAGLNQMSESSLWSCC